MSCTCSILRRDNRKKIRQNGCYQCSISRPKRNQFYSYTEVEDPINNPREEHLCINCKKDYDAVNRKLCKYCINQVKEKEDIELRTCVDCKSKNCRLCNGAREGNTLIFTVPQCDLVCTCCGAIQPCTANYTYINDGKIRKQLSINDTRSKNTTIGTCVYDPSCDVSSYKRTQDYAGYVHVFHANELIARTNRPIIPDEALSYLYKAAHEYYQMEVNRRRNYEGLDFDRSDAKRICLRASQIFGKENPNIPFKTRQRGNRKSVTAFRIQSYADRWPQLWKLLIRRDMLNPRYHPIFPERLEERVRIRAAVIIRCWVDHLRIPKGHQVDRHCTCTEQLCFHKLSSKNCRFALFIRAILVLEHARTSIRRVYRLDGTKVPLWYKRLCYLWPFLIKNYKGVYSTEDFILHQITWPDQPPPLHKLTKEIPVHKQTKNKVYKPRWYEKDEYLTFDERDWWQRKRRKVSYASDDRDYENWCG